MQTAKQMLEESTQAVLAKFGGNRFGYNHANAMAEPQPGFESAIVFMLKGWAEYADAHAIRYEGDPIGTDGVLGEHWEAIGKGILGLLNGETGRLDCGTIDGVVRKIGALNGAEGEDYETSHVSPAARRASIRDACSCPEDQCACKRRTEDGEICKPCEQGHHTIAAGV